MTDLKVIQLPAAGVTNIPTGLRNLADLIENETSDCAGFIGVKALVWASIDSHGNTAAGGLGYSIDKHKTAGIMHQAMLELLKESRP